MNRALDYPNMQNVIWATNQYYWSTNQNQAGMGVTIHERSEKEKTGQEKNRKR